MTLLAKSLINGGTTLEDHTEHVHSAIRILSRKMLPNISEEEFTLVQHGAILHDLGKAHPYFQDSLQPNFDRQRDVLTKPPHRHELSSLLFLPLFPVEGWPVLIDLVVAHHKSLRLDPSSTRRGLGLLDMVRTNEAEVVFDRHAEDWEQWHPLVFPLLEKYDIPTRLLNRTEARDAFFTALAHCKQSRYGRSRWRGLLMSADHFASALQEGTETRAEKLFVAPDLSYFHQRADKADELLHPLAKMDATDVRRHTLVVAPTGSGKTDFLLRRCKGDRRVFYLLPFQASINAMYLRLNKALNGDENKSERLFDVRRVHASSRIDLSESLEEEQVLQKHPGAAIKVMTPHQLASILLGTSGHEAAALDVAGQDVILDEVHVYDERTQAMMLEMVRSLVGLGANIHVGSATIPKELAKLLREQLGGEAELYEVSLSESALKTYDRHIVYRLDDEKAAREQVSERLANNERVLFIANRVDCAQARFLWAKEAFPDIQILLLHSRFRRGDRADRERQIEVFDNMPGPCLVCATQVVEVSLDISFDTLVTDAAPLDSLIQRFGRVNRRRPNLGLRPVYVIAPPEDTRDALPYQADLLARSWAALPHGKPLLETSIQEKIDAVYPIVDIPGIDVHIAEFNGEFRLPHLCHRPKSLLLEMLEIESASCIRKSDYGAYLKGKGDERMLLEIPIPWKTALYRLRGLTQLKDTGSNPFLVPDAWYDPFLGLTLSSKGELPQCTQFL